MYVRQLFDFINCFWPWICNTRTSSKTVGHWVWSNLWGVCSAKGIQKRHWTLLCPRASKTILKSSFTCHCFDKHWYKTASWCSWLHYCGNIVLMHLSGACAHFKPCVLFDCNHWRDNKFHGNNQISLPTQLSLSEPRLQKFHQIS